MPGGEGFGLGVFGGVGGDEFRKVRLLGGSQAAVLGALDGLEGTKRDLPAVAAFEAFDGDRVGGGALGVEG